MGDKRRVVEDSLRDEFEANKIEYLGRPAIPEEPPKPVNDDTADNETLV